MAMTKKDYELVARAILNQRNSITSRTAIEFKTLDDTIETMAAHFALMNDRFNKSTFMEAAGHGKNRND